jgi:SsrA-binding protein
MAGAINNKKASYTYFLTDKVVAGIMLTGTEIKSIRGGHASINEAYCRFTRSELFVHNMYIKEYENGGYTNHEPYRKRKLLLNAHEIKKLQKKVKDVGNTIVPVKLFIAENGFAKLEIALGKGKKLHDKRQDLKSKDLKREIERGRFQ